MPQNIFRLRLKMCFACGAPTKSQILFCLRRANQVSKFASPVARQHHKVSKFLLVRLTPAAHQKKPPDSVRLRRANKASNESLFRLRRTYKLHRTRTRILLRLRRANIASNTIVLRLRRANKEGLKICVACGAPTIPQKVVRFTCGANKGYQSNFGSVCLQRATTQHQNLVRITCGALTKHQNILFACSALTKPHLSLSSSPLLSVSLFPSLICPDLNFCCVPKAVRALCRIANFTCNLTL